MPPATPHANGANGHPDDTAYPSRNIAFTAASMITSIIENLQTHDEIRFCPAFMYVDFPVKALPIITNTSRSVYSLFSALIMHVYQMRSNIPSVVAATQQRMKICMNALKEVSKVWLVAKMVHTLFESILGNKILEERLQKASGKRHSKVRHSISHSHGQGQIALKAEEPSKRKYDDMELGFNPNGPPTPQVSYERSRPQTPAVTPSRDLGHPGVAIMGAPNIMTSPQMRQQTDAFMGDGNSRSNTRPPTPFNPSFSVPATPPDLYLATRSSPLISQSLWENFQPDQLFPEGSVNMLPQYSPQPTLDPQLAQQMSQMGQQTTTMQQMQMTGQTTQIPQRGSRPPGESPISNMQGSIPASHGIQVQHHGWPNQMDSFDGSAGSPDETWSNSSRGGVVPNTLNVEDWFVPQHPLKPREPAGCVTPSRMQH
jgi:hypothetical protein